VLGPRRRRPTRVSAPVRRGPTVFFFRRGGAILASNRTKLPRKGSRLMIQSSSKERMHRVRCWRWRFVLSLKELLYVASSFVLGGSEDERYDNHGITHRFRRFWMDLLLLRSCCRCCRCYYCNGGQGKGGRRSTSPWSVGRVLWRIGWLHLFGHHHAFNSNLKSDREYLSVNTMTYFLLGVPTSCPHHGRSRVGVQLGVQWTVGVRVDVECGVWSGCASVRPPTTASCGQYPQLKTVRPVDDNFRADDSAASPGFLRASRNTHCLSTLDQHITN
jgi:hypothetical protein